MPVSTLQHRASVGTYHNKLHDNLRGSDLQTEGPVVRSSDIPDAVRHFGSTIYRAANSGKKMHKSSDLCTAPQKGWIAPLTMLLSNIRFDDIHVPGNYLQPAPERETLNLTPDSAGQSGNSNNLQSRLYESMQDTTSRVDEFIKKYDFLRFPGADATPLRDSTKSGTIDNTHRIPRYAVFEKKTPSPAPMPDDVKIEKLDFSCFEERANLSIADVFRKIGETLSNPVSELAKESQVIHYYNNYHRCPTPEEMNHLLSRQVPVINIHMYRHQLKD